MAAGAGTIRTDISGMARRAKWAGSLLAVLLVFAVASLLIASRSSVSATQAAANATPPPPGPTTAQVEERPLAETLSVRGVITAPTAVEVSAPVAPAEGTRSIVTGLFVEPGAVLTPPTVLGEVAGRPVIALSSPTAFYRDLSFGDEGNDVHQLQQILGVGKTGVFDAATQEALSATYDALGYSTPLNDTVDPAEEPDSIQPLKDALEDAHIAGDATVQIAELALSEAQSARTSGVGSDATVRQAELELKTARETRGRGVARAERDLAAERENAQIREARSGPRFAADEFVALPFSSTTVIGVSTVVGKELEPGQTMLTLGDPVLRAVTYVSLAEAQMLQPQMVVSVTASTLPSALRGSVASVASEPSGVDSASSEATAAAIGSTPSQERPYRVEVDLTEQPPSTSVGTGALLTITVQGTGSSVVAVPVAALQRIGGEDVVVTSPDRRRWTVEPGFSAEGWVEIRAGAPPVGSPVETR